MICAAIACILAVTGPFGTDEVMRFAPRLAYWAFLVVLPYAWGFLVDASLRRMGLRLPAWMTILISGLLTGLGVSAIVMGANAALLGFVPRAEDLPEFLISILAISFIVTLTFNILGRRRVEVESAGQAPAILDRLPFEKRAALVALSVEDHYVRVQTLKGEELILMRLSDAMREVGGTPGAQVHRSHWAAFDAVAAVRREGDRAILTMSTGVKIPVSRANLPKLKEAGLLPERA